MKRFLILVLGLVSAGSYAQNATEEAIILNQELQFLEDSVNNVQSVSINTSPEARRSRALNEPSLETKYFGEDLEEDVVSTQTASPKRRGL
ncbi:MAG: hypothetical protein ACLGHN_01475 [Bacteriovoracia bacterium]